MSTILNIDELYNQISDNINAMIKDKLEVLMREEIRAYLEEETDANSRNGYYNRGLETKHGVINDLEVPRDRKSSFQTQLFAPYQRRDHFLEESIVALYQTGVSTRNISKYINQMLGTHYSPATISNITEGVREDIEAWHKRPVASTYFALMLDGISVKLRRDSVDKESIYLVLGMKFDGSREILGFYVGGRESSNGWKEVLLDLRNRGLNHVQLGVFDGLPGLEDAFHSIFPLADIQRCVVHKMRNLLSKVRKKDQSAISADFKRIYTAVDMKDAYLIFEECKTTWYKKYRRELDSWEDDLPALITFLKYPHPIRRYIYTTNIIERMNKEIRKRLKTMNSLPSIEAVEKIVYLSVSEYNSKGHVKGMMSGFGSVEKEMLILKESLIASSR